MSILHKVHHVCPALQRDHEEDGHPGQPYVVEGDGPVEGVGGASGAPGVVLEHGTWNTC